MLGRNERPTRPVSLALWNFTPSWFLIPQGMGVIALILHQLHYQFGALPILAEIVWMYTIVLLGLFLIIALLRLLLYPKHVTSQIRVDVVEASCLASIPITFTSIIQMVVLQYGGGADLAAYVLWWISTFLSVAVGVGVPFLQLKLQPAGLKNLPPPFLLPVIAILTSAAGGGVLCTKSGLSARLKVPAIIVSYLEVGAGIAMALCIDACIVYHHFDRTHPERNKVYQDMIICGPFGQGSFALQTLGLAVHNNFGDYNRGTLLTAEAASPIAIISEFAGLLAWGFGTFWWLLAILSIVSTLYFQSGGWRTISFSLTAWSLIFPWGVYTNAAVELGKLMDSPAFHVWSTALLLLLVVLAIVLNLLTVKGIVTGKLLGIERGWKVPESKEQSV